MAVKNLSFGDLSTIITLANHSNMSEAAASLNITQPALSERLQKIEAALNNSTLFERSRRGVTVTQLGAQVVEQAQLLLNQTSALQTLVEQPQAPLTGRLRLGAIATLGPYYVPHILGPLKKHYPRCELYLQENQTHVLLDALHQHQLDAALIALPFDIGTLQARPLFYEPFVLATPHNHTLANKKHVSRRDLDAADMVLLAEGHCLSDHTISECPSNRREYKAQVQATSLETLRHMIAAGHGYSLLPWLAVGDKPPLKNLVHYRTFKQSDVPKRTIALVWRKSFARMHDINAVSDLLLQHLPKGLQPF